MNNIGYKVIVSGRVQGVCFRYSTAQQARKLNIVGHAKNLSDGSVEVVIFGEPAALQILLEWLHKGPKSAVVKHIRIAEIVHEKKVKFLTL